MKKVFKMQDLECANCAAKMEAMIAKIDGVERANMNFMTQKLTLVISDDAKVEDILEEAGKICRRIEPDCRILGV